MTRLSIVIPTMNEERSIGLVIDEIKKGLPASLDYEIIIVDTDSKDKTIDIAASKGAKVIDEPRRGYGRAYKTGFEKSSGEIIATLDADMTYPADRIADLMGHLDSEGLDFITTNRFAELQPGAMRSVHRFGNWILSTTTRLLFWIKLKDSQSGMWVFRRSILPKLDIVSDGMAMSEELKIEAFRKTRAKEFPIRYSPRIGDVKLSSWGDGTGNLRFLFSKKFGRAR
ncbi:MAG TPA: glycosyltransferase family 2 protein [Thermoplasmata archaeon]|nr:glycosyltransferase family 2 protein [Thermoplasmata archaeon]